MEHTEFIDRVAQRGNLDQEQAEALTKATLDTLAERITGGEAQDLASQLPEGLEQHLTGVQEAAEAFTFEEFQNRVRDRSSLPSESVAKGVPAVFAVLGLAVTAGQFDHVISHLPREYRDALGVAG